MKTEFFTVKVGAKYVYSFTDRDLRWRKDRATEKELSRFLLSENGHDARLFPTHQAAKGCRTRTENLLNEYCPNLDLPAPRIVKTVLTEEEV